MRRLSVKPFAALRPLFAVETLRALHFPVSKPPIDISYLDADPLEYALRIEARKWGLDDLNYMRELAFVRIADNPTVGQFRSMTMAERRNMFCGSDRQDFYREFVNAVTGKPEHLYHNGW